jgi:DNA primase
MPLSPEKIQEVREATNIVDLVGQYVTLRLRGHNYFGLCPFHEEKTPSFAVHPDRQIFRCFGCGKGGNVFGFLMEIEKISFIEAVRILAQKAGIELPRYDERAEEGHSEAELLAKANTLARDFFHQQLLSRSTTSAGEAYDYLMSRGYTPEVITKYMIGYAPAGWDALATHARLKGFDLGIFVRAGLLKEGRESGRPYDAFRHRLMFPIRNLSGRVIAFGGRRLSEEGDEANEAKYINSPETAIYQKGRELFGLWEARNTIRKNGRAILVEGYTDLITLVAAGVQNVVASLGTSLTAEQVKLLNRFTPEIFVMYDGDAAGRNAARRAVDVILTEGLVPRVVLLPENHDPDSFVRSEGAEALWSLVNSALGPVEFQMQLSQGTSGKATAATRMAAIRSLLETARLIKKPVAREIFLGEISEKTGVALDALRQELPRQVAQAKSARETARSSPFKLSGAALELVRLLIRCPDLRPRILSEFDPKGVEDDVLRPLVEKIEELSLIETEEPQEVLFDYFPENPLRDFIAQCLTEPPPNPDVHLARAIWRQTAEDCLLRLKLGKLQTEIRGETERLTEAKNRGDDMQEILGRIQLLRRQEMELKEGGKKTSATK